VTYSFRCQFATKGKPGFFLPPSIDEGASASHLSLSLVAWTFSGREPPPIIMMFFHPPSPFSTAFKMQSCCFVCLPFSFSLFFDNWHVHRTFGPSFFFFFFFGGGGGGGGVFLCVWVGVGGGVVLGGGRRLPLPSFHV